MYLQAGTSNMTGAACTDEYEDGSRSEPFDLRFGRVTPPPRPARTQISVIDALPVIHQPNVQPPSPTPPDYYLFRMIDAYWSQEITDAEQKARITRNTKHALRLRQKQFLQSWVILVDSFSTFYATLLQKLQKFYHE